MEEYKPNSHKYKEETKKSSEEKNITPVVKGKVTRKKNNVRKLTDTFVNEDMHNVKSYIVFDVLIPAAKKAISDIVTNGIDMILYGETRSKHRSGTSTYVSYDRFSDRDRDDRYRYRDSRTRSGYSYDDIVLETRREAEEVLRAMDEILDRYKIVSVADMYDLMNVRGDYTDNKYGWDNLRSADVVRVRDGYILKLPKPMPID